jgi:hypothetical protein
VAKLADAPYELAEKIDSSKEQLSFSRKEVIDLCLIKVTKVVTITDNLICVDYCLENFGIKKVDFIFGIEFNLSLYDSQICDASGEAKAISKFVIHDLWKSIKLEYSLEPQANVWSFPVQTISDSESGIEKAFQQLCVFFNWKLSLEQNTKFNINLKAKLT